MNKIPTSLPRPFPDRKMVKELQLFNAYAEKDSLFQNF